MRRSSGGAGWFSWRVQGVPALPPCLRRRSLVSGRLTPLAKSSVDLWYLTILFRKLTEVIRFHGVRGPCAMGLSVVLNKIIKGWLGFSDPSQERNLYAGKRMDDLVPFDDDYIGAGSQYWQRGFGCLDGRREGIFIWVDRGEKMGRSLAFP